MEHYYLVMFERLINQKNFSLDRLATFCELLDAGSIGEATRFDSSRQSKFSKQVKELESFFGEELLDRRSKPHRVTEKGLQLARIVRPCLTELEDFIVSCNEEEPDRIVFGAGESLIQWLLIPEIRPRLRNELPEAGVVFQNLQTEAIISSLQNGEIDIGFVRKDAVLKNLKSTKSIPLGYRLFVPKKFRAKLKSPVNLRQLDDLPVALLEGTGQLRSRINLLSKEAGIKLNVVTECSSSTQLALLVNRKECCVILPSFAAGDEYGQVNRQTTDDYTISGFKKLERKMCFAWNPKRTEVRPIIEQVAKICERS